jgi:hypothetical protein
MEMRVTKVVEAPFPEDEFDKWEWGDGDLAPILKHIRLSTAKVIADQILTDCEGVFYEEDTLFHVTIWDDFIVSFDILKALSEGEIAFVDLDDLKMFTSKIDAVSDNLHKAIEIAEKGTASEEAAP